MPILILALAVIIVDQLTKDYVQRNMDLGTSLPVFQDFFHITYILNPGAAFGILEYKTGLLVSVAIIIIPGLIYLYRHIPRDLKLLRMSFGFLAGGTIGNVIDRVKTGYVIDFLDFRIWPIFNIADIAIVCGVAFMIWTLLQTNKEVKNDE